MATRHSSKLSPANGPWRDDENAFHGREHSGAGRAAADPSARLEALKHAGRAPRVAAYDFAVNGQDPEASLQQVRTFARRLGWQVSSPQTFIDYTGGSDPSTRSGWLLIKQQLRSGFIHGVVVLGPSVVSPRHDAYERELTWDHGGFIATVCPGAITSAARAPQSSPRGDGAP